MSVGFIPATAYASELLYWYEDSFRGGLSSTYRRFGWGQRLTRFEINRDYERVFITGDRRMQQHIYKQFNAEIGIECTMSDPYILGWLLKPVVSGTANELTGYEIPNKIISGAVRMYFGVPGESTDSNTYFLVEAKGAVAESLEITIRAGELVTASLDMRAAELSLTTSDVSIPSLTQDSDSGTEITPNNYADRVYTFATAELDIDGSTTVPVREISLTIENNPELVWVVGDDKATTAYLKEFMVTGSFTVYMQDAKYIDKLLKNEAFSSLKIKLYGVKTTGTPDTNKYIEIALSNIIKEERTSARIEPVEPIEQEISFVASDINITVAGYLYY